MRQIVMIIMIMGRNIRVRRQFSSRLAYWVWKPPPPLTVEQQQWPPHRPVKKVIAFLRIYEVVLRKTLLQINNVNKVRYILYLGNIVTFIYDRFFTKLNTKNARWENHANDILNYLYLCLDINHPFTIDQYIWTLHFFPGIISC